MMKQPFRLTHLFAFLQRFDAESRPLDAALSEYLRAHKSIGAHDRRFLGDTVYALIRWKGLLDHFLGASAPWEERYALYLRLDFTRLGDSVPLFARYGSSPWLFSELARDYGEEAAIRLSTALNEPAPVTIRANLLKTTREELLASLAEEAASAAKYAPAAIHFKKRLPLHGLSAFKEGKFEIQDEGSQLVADLVRPEPGEQFLDYCSGSGGKSLAIAPRMKGKGQIYLHDIRPQILKQARVRLRRAGIENAQFLPPDHPRLRQLQGKIDWVLADVPCSGSGTYRRNPDMKWKADEALLERLVLEQREIFSLALDYLRPGGKIVYATCSLFKRENEEQLAHFLARHPIELVGAPLSILPEKEGPDGFFAALFCKKI